MLIILTPGYRREKSNLIPGLHWCSRLCHSLIDRNYHWLAALQLRPGPAAAGQRGKQIACRLHPICRQRELLCAQFFPETGEKTDGEGLVSHISSVTQ